MAITSANTIVTNCFATMGKLPFGYTDNGIIVHVDANYFIITERNFV